MPKQFQLKIADPCHEDWEKMTHSEKGKFCGSCQKQVIDFTGMTDTQLAVFFKKPTTGSLCGRFFNDQLDKKITIPRKRIPWIRYFFQITLPLFLASCTGNRTKGKVAVETVQKESISKRAECTVTSGIIMPPVFMEETPIDSFAVVGEIGVEDIDIIEPADSTVKESQADTSERKSYGNLRLREDIMDKLVDEGIQVKGVVLNEDGQPVPFASIEEGMIGTAADSVGAFSLTLASNYKDIKLNVSSVGYESKEVIFTREQFSGKEPLIIRLKQNIVLNEVVISNGYTMGKLRRTVTGSVSSVTHCDIIKSEVRPSIPQPVSSFKVYANPAKANSNVFIDAKKSEDGLYTIQLLSMTGQLIKQQQAKIEKGMGVISFSIPAIPSASYIVRLSNKESGKNYSEILIVQ